jgi:hypothetical protein
MDEVATGTVGWTTAARAEAAGAARHDALRDAWLQRIDEIYEEAGYFQPLGARHWAAFVDAGPQLLVTFETAEEVRLRPDGLPLGHALAAAQGWSLLCLIAEGATWYRDPAVWAFFDRQVDDAFFEDFDEVLFLGAAMGGYGACAFSVTAPGARVLAICPRATLVPSVAGWDRRDLHARRLDFRTRYGFAPAMTEGAGHVAVIHDPLEVLDAAHAALFLAPHAEILSTPLLGPRPDRGLARMGVLAELAGLAMQGRLDALAFAKLWRRRRGFGPYLRALLDRAAAGGHPGREQKICRSVLRAVNARTFGSAAGAPDADELAEIARGL